MKFIKWLGTLIEDKRGSISHKRIGFFWCLWMLERTSKQPVINEIWLWAIVGLAFGLAGLTIPEWFDKVQSTATKKTTEETSVKTN